MTILTATVTAAELAELSGFTERHIRRLDLPKAGRNSYELGPALKALLAHQADKGETTDIQAEKLRKLRAEASLAELELAKARGEVAAIEDFERVQQHCYAIIQANMLNVPRRVVPSIIGSTDETQMTAALTREIKQVLADAAEALKNTTTDDLDDDQDHDE
jgi:phage terminase Nu1 subunit (DNA packaging protein)